MCLPRTYVNINNLLQTDLLLHCKSKDDDLGAHVLPPHGSFGFNFRPNVGCSTLYFCNFEWRGGSHWFDIYIEDRDANECRHCNWLIIEKGAFRLVEGKARLIDECYEWKKSAPKFIII
ncbi:hypothetical protein ACFX1S_039963 [Malus domestica]